MTDNIQVEVAYALPDKQRIESLKVTKGTTALEAVRLSGIDRQFDHLDVHAIASLGIFGQVVEAGQVLKDGDRVEIHRPLNVDPKEARKRRAEALKAKKRPLHGR